MAVPALRVLEDRDGSNGKKIKKNIKGGVIVKGGGIGIGTECSEDGSVVDVIDERGFVDGVKVARKCSKANVLGKAVEYIRVLKRREKRLKAELAGVKVLVEGLVGGPALIMEWEKQWRAKFGGEEKDEVEGEDDEGEGEDDESEDEDGDEGDEEGAGRKRKRARVSNPSSSTASKKADIKKEKKPASSPFPPVVVLSGEQSGNPVPEKRKRGRPRKILPPPVTIEPVASAAQSAPPSLLPAAVIVRKDGSLKQDEAMRTEASGQWQSPPQQYLLAVFALFSFFNSPLTASSMGHDYSHHHHHTGKVLTPLHPPLVFSPEIVSQFVPPPSVAPVSPWKEYVQLFHLAVSFLVLASFMGNWLGFRFGVSRSGFSLEKRGWGLRLTSRKGNDKKGIEDCIKDAEERILLGKYCFDKENMLRSDNLVTGERGSFSHFERFLIYRAISARVNLPTDSLVSAAIALNSASGFFAGLARLKARRIWDDAGRRSRVQVDNHTAISRKVTEELVFGATDLDRACERLAGRSTEADVMSDGGRPYSPIEVLACGVVKERLRSHLGKMFVGRREDKDEVEEEEESEVEEEKRRRTVDASRELGGKVEEMGRLFERIWKLGVGVGGVGMRDVEGVFLDGNSGAGELDEEIRALFVALVLYDRLFGEAASESEFSEASDTETETERGHSSSSSSLLSPPPSPGATFRAGTLNAKSTKRAKMMLELRGVLGSRVFEGCAGGYVDGDGAKGVEGLEEAKDQVVDLIVNFERRDR
jgi:hypothetical protein